jgi:hypothetical protein
MYSIFQKDGIISDFFNRLKNRYYDYCNKKFIAIVDIMENQLTDKGTYKNNKLIFYDYIYESEQFKKILSHFTKTYSYNKKNITNLRIADIYIPDNASVIDDGNGSLKSNEYIIENMRELWTDYIICRRLVECDPFAIQIIPDKYITDELYNIALSSNYDVSKYIKKEIIQKLKESEIIERECNDMLRRKLNYFISKNDHENIKRFNNSVVYHACVDRKVLHKELKEWFDKHPDAKFISMKNIKPMQLSTTYHNDLPH